MPPKASKRRKTQGDEQDGTQKTSKARNVRGKARGGSQANLANIPMDVFMEIMAYLLPLDLLHLARTTKGFREFLMNRAVSLPFWKGARRNVHGLPECPDLLSEPEYACLVFGTACNGCGTQRGVDSGPLFEIGVRLCKKCLENETGKLDTRGYRGANDWLALKDALPNQVAHNYWYVYRRYDIPFQSRTKTPTSGTRILVSEVEKMQAIWNKTTPGGREALMAERKRMIEQWNRLKGRIKTWMQARETERLKHIEKLKQIRQDAIFAKLADAGWSEEIANLKNDRTNFAKFVTQTTGNDTKELTDREWPRIAKASVVFLEKFKRDNQIKKLAVDLGSHIYSLRSLIEEQEFKFKGIFPRAQDFALLPAVREILESSADKESVVTSLKKLEPQMHELVEKWKTHATARLVKEVNAAVPSLKLPKDANLDVLAIGAHLCCDDHKCHQRGCSPGCASVLSYPDVLVQTCASKAGPQLVDTVDIYSSAVMQAYNATGHAYAPWVFPVMKHIIEACGCNPRTATREGMDALEIRLLCAHKECHSVEHTQGVEAFYTWRTAFRHAVENGREASKFKSAKNELSNAVLLKIKDIEESAETRTRPGSYGGKWTVVAHIKKDHHVEEPSQDDLYWKPIRSYVAHDSLGLPVLLVSPELSLREIFDLPSDIVDAVKKGFAHMKPSV